MEKLYGSAVTSEFLLKYFAPKELEGQTKRDLLEKAEEKYIRLINRLNQKRQRSGKHILTDSDLVDMIIEYQSNQQP